jgi:putative redox protein
MSEKRIVATHAGKMHFDVATGSGHDVVLDDGEGDAGPRPTEMLLASLVACSAMDVVSLLVKKRQPFTAYRVEARGSQQSDYPQVYTWIELVHVVEGAGVDDAKVRRSIELSATKYCPINAMISAGPTEVQHRFRIVDSATEPAETREGLVMVTGPSADVFAAAAAASASAVPGQHA